MRNSWPTIRSIARVDRKREHLRAGKLIKIERETVYLISSLTQANPKHILSLNRTHWRIEIMHRDKDVILGEDHYTNRMDHAPRNIFTLTSATRTLLKHFSKSSVRAIEIVQENRTSAVSWKPRKTWLFYACFDSLDMGGIGDARPRSV